MIEFVNNFSVAAKISSHFVFIKTFVSDLGYTSGRADGVLTKIVVVANEGRARNLRKVRIVSESLKFWFVENGPQEAELEQGVDCCCCRQ